MHAIRAVPRIGKPHFHLYATSSSNLFSQPQKRPSITLVPRRNFSIETTINEFRSFSEAFAGTTLSKNVIEFFMENCDLGFTASLAITGIIIRFAVTPFYYFAEKNNAMRIHAQNIIAARVSEKLAKRYGLKTRSAVVGDVNVVGIATTSKDSPIHKELFYLLEANILKYNNQNGLNPRHTLYLLSLPAIPYFSLFFAARDMIFGNAPVTLGSWLWIPDLLHPDPFFVMPFFVTSFFVANHLLRVRMNRIDNFGIMQPTLVWRLIQGSYGVFYVFLFAAIANAPGTLQLYWLTIGIHGLLQNLLLRTPAVKKRIGIPWLPSDRKFSEWKDYLLFWRMNANLPKNKPSSS